jgi:hypothetical protein
MKPIDPKLLEVMRNAAVLARLEKSGLLDEKDSIEISIRPIAADLWISEAELPPK